MKERDERERDERERDERERDEREKYERERDENNLPSINVCRTGSKRFLISFDEKTLEYSARKILICFKISSFEKHNIKLEGGVF